MAVVQDTYLAVLKASYDYDPAADAEDEIAIKENQLLFLLERTDEECDRPPSGFLHEDLIPCTAGGESRSNRKRKGDVLQARRIWSTESPEPRMDAPASTQPPLADILPQTRISHSAVRAAQPGYSTSPS